MTARGRPVIAVEGYVDVIAMVTAGFEATVAPLGTALTADQLALMWRMADEPILCFDGDDAGRRAAYRARRPGAAAAQARQEPEVRGAAATGRTRTISPAPAAARRSTMCSARRGRSPTCYGRARAKPDRSIRRSAAPRWRRASTRSPPHRRRSGAPLLPAGFRARGCAQLFAPARDCRRQFAPARQFRRAERRREALGGRGRGRQRPYRPPRRRFAGAQNEPYVAASPQLAASPLHRGHRAAIPRREALILQAALNHPWLLHDHLEELAEAEFRHADTQKLKGALIDVFAHGGSDASRNPPRR